MISFGKRLYNYGKTPSGMGKLTISMAIFKSYVKLPEGNNLAIEVDFHAVLFLPRGQSTLKFF